MYFLHRVVEIFCVCKHCRSGDLWLSEKENEKYFGYFLYIWLKNPKCQQQKNSPREQSIHKPKILSFIQSMFLRICYSQEMLSAESVGQFRSSLLFPEVFYHQDNPRRRVSQYCTRPDIEVLNTKMETDCHSPSNHKNKALGQVFECIPSFLWQCMSSVRSTLKSSVTSSQQREPSSRPTNRLSGGLSWLLASWMRNGVDVWTHESAVIQDDWASICAWVPAGKKTNVSEGGLCTLSMLSRTYSNEGNTMLDISTHYITQKYITEGNSKGLRTKLTKMKMEIMLNER